MLLKSEMFKKLLIPIQYLKLFNKFCQNKTSLTEICFLGEKRERSDDLKYTHCQNDSEEV